ncbi:hypothetical protein BDB00DRAFT_786179 [Zychaea mexicana]|uniref:uncharacterized protein n=1 Tax=Zychaea mexicana TaxID=64656 RepID=UPI0022FE251D|nr:uncharacterized protein BDB00DRAFT_786179 [Zychaea mexicana]KAI9495655.1 hypothetical protein BDB00DRAFT_786179 [Zychaea mexicana]
MSNPKPLDIELLEPVVHLHGRRGDAVIRGSIGVTVSRPHTLKSLAVLFEGDAKLLQSNYKVHQRRIAHHQLILYPTTTTTSTSQQRSLLLQPGTTRFAFEMQLPPGLAGTIRCDQINVDYNLVSSIQYSRRSSITVMKHRVAKPIHLIRPPSSSTLSVLVNGENVESSVDSQKQHTRWCQYRVTIDQRAAIMGQLLPITLSIAPHLDSLCLEHVYTQLVEQRCVREKESGEWETHKSTHMLLPVLDGKSCMFTPGKSMALREPWQGTLLYRISAVMQDDLVRTCKRESPDYYINHSILVSFVVSYPVLCQPRETRRCSKTLVFQADIDLLDSQCCSPKTSSDETFQGYWQTLPPYEEYSSSPASTSSLLSVPDTNTSHLLMMGTPTSTATPPSAVPPPAYDEICAL